MLRDLAMGAWPLAAVATVLFLAISLYGRKVSYARTVLNALAFGAFAFVATIAIRWLKATYLGG